MNFYSLLTKMLVFIVFQKKKNEINTALLRFISHDLKW